jgi:ornithine carbamoyltransferase
VPPPFRRGFPQHVCQTGPFVAGSEDIQLGKNETLRDTARVLSRFNDLILARVFSHAHIGELCAESTVPVINALSDAHHPLQGLADLLTMQDHFGKLAGLTVAWVGDGNNITHTLLEGAARMGYHMQVATPVGYDCDHGIVQGASQLAVASGSKFLFTRDPSVAVHNADVVVTDTWVSMGQEAETEKRLQEFAGYQVTEQMVQRGGAKPHWVFLHCLPRKPYEVDDAVFYSDRSLVFDEAENRKWTLMALTLAQLHGGADVPVPATPYQLKPRLA